MYGFWDYWLAAGKVTFDGINKTISVNFEVTALDIRADVYSAWVNWAALQDNTLFLQAIRYTGLDPMGGGVYTGDTYFLKNGWKLLVDLTKVKITGALLSDDFDTAYYAYDLTPQYPVTVSSLVTTVVTTNTIPVITGDLGSLTIPTALENAAAVRTELAPELSKIMSQVDGLTPSQQTMLLEIYKLYGLDPSSPLIVTDTSRQAGTINQNINSTTTQTTVTRV